MGTVGEAIRAIRANTEQLFRKVIGGSKGYVLVADGVPIEPSGCFSKRIKKHLKIMNRPFCCCRFDCLWYVFFNYGDAAGCAETGGRRRNC